MRSWSIVMLSLVALAVTGCGVGSENGLCSPDEHEAIFDPDLVGEWNIPEEPFGKTELQPRNGVEGDFLKLERDNPTSKAYRITVCDKSKKERGEPEKAYLVRLGEFLFLDFYHIRTDPKRPGLKPSAMHYFLRVELKKPEAGKDPRKVEVTLQMLDPKFIANHTDSIACVWKLDDGAYFQPKNYDLRLMFDAKDASVLPTKGRSLIAVAAGGPNPQVRIFNYTGSMIMNLDISRMKEQASPIEDLKKKLEALRPPHQISSTEKEAVITAIFAINSNASPVGIRATSEELREIVQKNARNEAAWEGTKTDRVFRRR